MVPLQDPMRYFPLAQFKLLHAAQAVFEVPVQPPDLYLPASHDAHVLHWNPFVVPLQDPLRYFPLAQFAWEHAEQAVFEVPVQPPLLYWPDGHAAQAEHV